MPPPPLRPPSSRASEKRSVAWPHGRRTSARYATVPLQNPLAPPPHGVFGSGSFNEEKQCLGNRKNTPKISRLTTPPRNRPTAREIQPSPRKNLALLPHQPRTRRPRQKRNRLPNSRHRPLPSR